MLGRKRVRWAVGLGGLTGVIALTASMAVAAAPNSAGAPGHDPGWVLTSSQFDSQFTAEPFVGNGYFSQRVPAAGMGHSPDQGEAGWPLGDQRFSEAVAAGLYANTDGSTIYPNADKEVIALIPTWSTLTFHTPSGDYSAATATSAAVQDYRQSEDLRTGTVTTSGIWTSPGGQQARFRYQVFTDRAREHVGTVSLELTPLWTGPASVTSLLDGTGARELSPVAAGVDLGDHLSYVSSAAIGTKQPVTEAATLRYDQGPGVRDSAVGLDQPQSAGEKVDFTAQAGHTYRFTKYVAVATGSAHDTTARSESRNAARLGVPALSVENAVSWARDVWRGDIVVPGRSALQTALRAGTYALYASIRADSPDAIGPSGLSSNGYAGMIFWDSDIWMFPALLAAHPDIARVDVDYRYNTLAAAEHDAQANGYQGAFYPWTAGDDGHTGADCYGTVTDANDKIISDPNASCSQELHLQADIAISQWEYYQATGDRQWLSNHGWPVLQALAQFWLSKAKPASSGGYDIDTVQPPDEQHINVNNSAYTNAAAATALRDATAAAQALGRQAPAEWATVADGLTKTMPFDQKQGIYQEFDGYQGDQVKQADVVMLSYPLGFPMPANAGLADLNYYAPRTNPDGPAMTDAIHSIDASALNAPGCSAYTYLLRSYEPFLRAPYSQFAETPEDKWTTFDFLTGVGGVLQEFQYGFTGLRFGVDSVHLDPSLPPQLPSLTVTDLHWQGRTFTVTMDRSHTTVTLTSGASLPLDTPSGKLTALPGQPVTVRTRQPDQQPTTDLARCQQVTASSAVPGSDAIAAVDGSPATAWVPTQPTAQLTVRLAKPGSVSSAEVDRGSNGAFAYTVRVSSDGQNWQTVATAPSTSSGTDRFSFPTVTAQFVRLNFTGPTAPNITGFTVR
ncbi:MAG TPA: discoidin domain-containing protein [Pseudonocardiaceae bacterium]|nr:discoidin domain-containing protein [Pseudonocardiaceae bacterium]